jgi:hypothetical protein
MRLVDEEDDIRFEAALQRIKDSRARGEPLSRRAAFRAVWRKGKWGSDADAAKAEQRFSKRLCDYRGGHRAAPSLRRSSARHWSCRARG